MGKFNALDQKHQNCVFTCKLCNFQMGYRLASVGCPMCDHHLFKVANRSGTPESFNPDKKDPYLRQKQKPMGNNDGTGYKLNTPGDEEGGGGLGTRFRGGLSPQGYSATDSEYKDQIKNDLPSEDTNLDHMPTEGTPNQGWFADPEDALSSTQMMNRNVSEQGRSVPMEKQLAKQRSGNSISRRLDDSIFGRTIVKLKGIQR